MTNHPTPWMDRVFAFWMGDNVIEPIRAAALASLSNTKCEVILVNQETLSNWIVGEHPLHEAFPLLSPVHRSDYLRAYFMHYHGGGYSDIKATTDSWLSCFRAIKDQRALGAGYTIQRGSIPDLRVSQVEGSYYLGSFKSTKAINTAAYWATKVVFRRFVGVGAFIFRPQTGFTRRWLSLVERRLDLLLPFLEENPAIAPKERGGLDYGYGPSRYPVPWSFLLGDIVIPLSARHGRAILHCLPTPSLENYQSIGEANRGHPELIGSAAGVTP